VSSDIRKRAEKIIAAITIKLDEGNINRLFDDSINKAVERFSYEVSYPVSHKQFHRIIACFLRYIYREGLKSPWELSDPLAKAISLFEGYYQGIYAFGYSAAMLDVNNSEQGGLEPVLSQLAESIKTLEREKYTRAIFAKYLDYDDWYLRCEIARILLQRCKMFLPPQMHNCTPEQIVDHIPSLMSTYLNSLAILQQLSGSYQE